MMIFFQLFIVFIQIGIFGFGGGKIQAEEIRLTRENGTASSGRIEDGTEEQYAKLKQLIRIIKKWLTEKFGCDNINELSEGSN